MNPTVETGTPALLNNPGVLLAGVISSTRRSSPSSSGSSGTAAPKIRLLLLGSFVFGAVFSAVGMLVFDRSGSPLAHAQDVAGCTNATLNGAYGARAQGFLVTGPDGTPFAQPVPVAAFNLLLADGAGNIIRTGTANFNGTINPNPGTGTYTVSPDCTFTVSFARPSGVPQTIDGVLVNAGTKAFVVTTNPATDPSASVTSVEWERL
jgi:hypothetical protein